MVVAQLQVPRDGRLNRRSPSPQILGIDVLSFVLGKNPLVSAIPTNPVAPPAIPVAPPTNPVRTPTNPVRTPANPVAPPTNPVRTPTNPVRTPANLVATPANPVATPVVTPANPVTTPANPVKTPANPVTPANLVATPANPVATPTNPVTTQTNPVATPTNPVATPTNPVATSTNPVATLANPVRTPTNFLVTTPQLINTSTDNRQQPAPTNPPPQTPTGTQGIVTSDAWTPANTNPSPGTSTANGDVATPNPTQGPSTAVSTSTALGSNSDAASEVLDPNASSTPSLSNNMPIALPMHSASSPFVSTGPGSGPGGSPRPTGTTSVNNERSRDLNIAALVGGVVGAVVGIALLVFVVFVFVRRRRALAKADMGDGTALLGASKGQDIATQRLSQVSTAESSRACPVSFGTQYGLAYNHEAAGVFVGRPSTSLSQQVERLASLDMDSNQSMHRLSDTVLSHAVETDIAEIRRSSMERPGDYKDAKRMSFKTPFLPEISVQMGTGLSIVSGSTLARAPMSEDPAGPTIVIGESAEFSNDNDSFYQGLSSISRITTKSSGSHYSQDNAPGRA